MDMENSLQNSFLRELEEYKFKLPNIKSIEIRKAYINSCSFQNFLQYWIPWKLANILIEKQFNKDDSYEDFYIGPIWKALLNVNKQVCLSGFNFNEKQLEQIIKYSFNWEILIFDTWVISCFKYFSFNISKKYKIKYLSFKNWEMGANKIDSDFLWTPSKFMNIIEAISKSQLKSSLQKVVIYNSSLNFILVQKWFDEFGMSHVKVVG